MAKGRTLWEMLLDKLKGPVEFQYYNPLRARIGSAVTLDEVEWRDLNFFVLSIHEYKRTIGGQEFRFVDYALVARPLRGDKVLVRLRLMPVDDPDQAAGVTHHVLLLQLDDDLPYDEALHKIVSDGTKKFQVLKDDKVDAEYGRINDTCTPYEAEVTIVRDVNLDKHVTRDEIEKRRVEYWDYWREVKDEAGQPRREFLFVEMDGDNGWFQIWNGREIDPKRVVMY
ncbi:MAG: hypothetical protein ACRELG_23510 [Gemmataceae bacterium]